MFRLSRCGLSVTCPHGPSPHRNRGEIGGMSPMVPGPHGASKLWGGGPELHFTRQPTSPKPGQCVCGIQKHCVGSKTMQKSKMSQNGSPWHDLGHWDRGPAQKFRAGRRGGPASSSAFCWIILGTPSANMTLLQQKEIQPAPLAADLGPHAWPMGPHFLSFPTFSPPRIHSLGRKMVQWSRSLGPGHKPATLGPSPRPGGLGPGPRLGP